MRDLQLDYPSLRELNPRLIVTSITPYGQTGPYADYKAFAINCCALGGVSQSIGHHRREPLTFPLSMGHYLAAVNGAAATMVAILARDVTGLGQHIDISEADVWATHHVGFGVTLYAFIGREHLRNGYLGGGWTYPTGRFIPCKDGHMALCAPQAKHWTKFVELMGNPEWAKEPRYRDRRAMECDYPEEVDALLAPWFLERTKQEHFEFFERNAIPFAPLYDIEDEVNDSHLGEREFFTTIDRDGSGKLPYPGAPYKFSGTPWKLERPAPQLGEHNEEICCGRLGCSMPGTELPRDPVEPLAGHRRNPPSTAGRSYTEVTRLPLQGYRIVDFGSAWAGAQIGHMLADMGAEVIKVESRSRIDYARLGGAPTPKDLLDKSPEAIAVAYPDHLELNPLFHLLNRGKLGITVDFTKPRGADLIKELVKKSDVVADNFTTGVLDKYGLGYDSLAAIKSDIIVVSLCLAGHTGPLKGTRGYAPIITALAGLDSMVGYLDESTPCGTRFAFGDHVAATHGALAVLIALIHRNRTGEGQYIDISEWEAVTSLLGEPLMDYAMNGRVRGPMGNRCAGMAPHGFYPCKGDQGWLLPGHREAPLD
jgi:crotonobetainyl-CoA:carnitine CoA-transferase CaiB-like acyl-CoA transferase